MLKFALIFLIVGLISAGAFILNGHQDILPPALAKFTPAISSTMVNTQHSVENAVTSVRNNQLKPLGDTIEKSGITSVDTNQEKPMHQKAMEFARFEYCKQVVREYEKKN